MHDVRQSDLSRVGASDPDPNSHAKTTSDLNIAIRAGNSRPTSAEKHAPFPFEELFRLAVLRLGLAPSEFWNMTPRELFVLLRAILPPAPPDRATLNELLRRYGDD